MRRILILAMTTGFTVLTANAGFAADPYTYRAGQAYMKAAAMDHSQCEAQCRGDAACRGWNFIRPNPRSRSGICEFNARKAVPQASPVSISGEISTGVDPLMSHAVPMGGSTIRVGTPIIAKREAPKPRIDRRQMAAAPAAPAPKVQQRIVKRLPVPDAVKTPAIADYKRTIPATPADVRTPRVYGGDAPQTQQAKLQTGPVKPRQMTRQQIYREQMLAAQKRAAKQAQIRARQQAVARLPQQSMPQQFVPRPQVPAAPMQTPYAHQPMPPQMQAPIQAPAQPPQPQVMPAQQSLYGSLHDDLTQNMTPVPRPETAPDQVENPDAPLSTSRAVPAKPVKTESLKKPAIPGLAGG